MEGESYESLHALSGCQMRVGPPRFKASDVIPKLLTAAVVQVAKEDGIKHLRTSGH